MALADLLATMERQDAVTPEPPCNEDRVTAKPLPIPPCTHVTPVTPQSSNDGQHYVVKAHDGINRAAVILSVAIRGKATCELRIPKSRYDAFALMELIEKHTTRETLQ